MDTPEKSPQQIGTPICKTEDSPVFNYINSLSPIKPVKSVHVAQTFHSLSFASIPSVFTSPHVNTQKESRFLIRYPLADLLKPEFSSDIGDENNLCPGVSNVVRLSDCAVDAQEHCNIKCSLNEATVEPPEECPTLPVKLPQSSQYDCGSPNHNTSPCYSAKTELKLVMGSTSLVEFVHDGPEERKTSFATEVEFQGMNQLEQIKEEVPGCEWENLITDDAEDLLIFDSPTESEAIKQHNQELRDHVDNYFTSSSKLAEDNIEDSQKTQPDGSLCVCLQNPTEELPGEHGGEVVEPTETDYTPQVLSTCQNKPVMSGPSEKKKINDEAEADDCIPLGYKVDYQHQRGMRRRCLVFEGTGSHKKNMRSDSKNNSSSSFPHNGKHAYDDRQPASFKPGIGSSLRVLPSIGLHLNTLAAISKDRMVTQDTLPCGRRLIRMPCSIGPFPSLTTGQKPPSSSLAVEKDTCSTDSEVQDLPVMQTSLQVPALGSGEEFNHSSPKKKKRKPENCGESEACKRCNCKKSKCLKLYCECFAAGVYCVEPCACQGCFNKPIHEDTVLATRKQIESRNPLAFAPKVIRTSEPITEEDANKTPASARHKRGCNCKKSSCLKKYCECFQGGVGCSVSCRCEGCKNAYGRKDGILRMGNVETEYEEEMDADENDGEKPDEVEQNADTRTDEQQFPENNLPITPSFQICRPTVKLPFFSSRKPPRSSVLAIGTSPRLITCHTLKKSEILPSKPKFEKHLQSAPEDETPEILRGDSSPISGVKTVSPNRKRVSPPHHEIGLSPSRKGGRKLILKSIPSFPPLTNDGNQ